MPTTLDVDSELLLNRAIAEVDGASSGTSFLIQFTGNISEGTDGGDTATYKGASVATPKDLFALNTAAGVQVTIDGEGFALDGANAYRGLFVYAGSVSVQNLTIEDTLAQGGAGGGGGGAGLGGGLFVANGGTVTASDLTFTGDAARGGNGGLGGTGGGGGLGGSGVRVVNDAQGGGGVGLAAAGGAGSGASGGSPGSTGIILGAASGGSDHAKGGKFGGGGAGGGGSTAGSGGGVGGDGPTIVNSFVSNGGSGGFGGGGGGTDDGTGGNGGFGGGGGGTPTGGNGGNGGFGGGGGAAGAVDDIGQGGQGGFGGGDGAGDTTVITGGYVGANSGGGGGGLGAGGDVFVQAGGSLIIESGSLAAGTVTGGIGGGTMSGEFQDNGSAYGSGIFLQGNETISLAPLAGQTLTVAGAIADEFGSGGTGANALKGGIIVDGAGVVVFGGNNTYAGGTFLDIGTLEIDSVANVGAGDITFDPGTETLLLGEIPTNHSTFADPFTGFTTGGTVDISTLTYVSGATAVASGTTLTLIDGVSVENFLLSSPATGTKFYAYSDGSGGTDVSSTACYCRDTLILTARGEVAVQDLRIGDLLVTHAGPVRPIRWVGKRSYAGRFAVGNATVQPILFRTGALAEGVPRRDLLVSPLHAMFLDGALVPARMLVNGRTVTRLHNVEHVEYFHLELDSHDVIVAEGAASESFVDDNSRGMFHNAAEYQALYPVAPREPARYCAPRVEGGDALEAIRARLATRADALPAGALRGFVDQVRPDRVTGWAQDRTAPDAPLRLSIRDNGVEIAEVTADLYRADLERAGVGCGRHGFRLDIPGGLSPAACHLIEVRSVAHAGATLPPVRVLEATEAAREIAPAARGMLDLGDREQIAGWAWSPDAPEAPVALLVSDNGVPVARVVANWHRDDLLAAGIGDGRHGFAFRFPSPLSPLERHRIEVVRERDGSQIEGSPRVIEAGGRFDGALARVVEDAVSAASDDAERGRVLSFMVAQSERLLQLRADVDGGRSERAAWQQFQRRWGPPGPPGPVDPAAGSGLRALVIDDLPPQPGRDAGSQAVLSHVRALQRLGYAVSFVPAGLMEPPAETAGLLASAGIALCAAPFYFSVEDVLRRQSGCFDVVYLHRAEIASTYLPLVRRHQPGARAIYSVADLHHVRLARQGGVEDRPELLAASQRMRLVESMAAWSADAVITHSDVEVDALRGLVPQANLHRVPWDFAPRAPEVAFAARHGIAFIGGYGHAPNVDAAHWLVGEVMPLVWRADPSIECRLVGSAMPNSVRRLAGPGVVVLGQVGDLARVVFDRVRLTVAPLRYGAGVKGKVLESMAAGVPCVMSEIAAEGIPLTSGLKRLVAGDAAGIAAAICRLHANPRANAGAARAGQAMIRRRFNEDAVTTGMRRAIGGLDIRMASEVAGARERG